MNTNPLYKMWPNDAGLAPAAENPASSERNNRSSHVLTPGADSNGVPYPEIISRDYVGQRGTPVYSPQPHPSYADGPHFQGCHSYQGPLRFPVPAGFPEPPPHLMAVSASGSGTSTPAETVQNSVMEPTAAHLMVSSPNTMSPIAASPKLSSTPRISPEQQPAVASTGDRIVLPKQLHANSQDKIPEKLSLKTSQGSPRPLTEPRSKLPMLAPLRQPSQPEKPASSEAKTESPPQENKSASKRNHKRTYQSLVGVLKLPPLKKRDGDALWRRDLQYDLLQAIFSDRTPAFYNTHTKQPNCTFADIYIDAMANSSKCSKLLAAKLMSNRSRAIKIAMVCLLVNCGRMNTTLNFFPEMKTQLRTYHPIPSLQTNDDQDYKQLQDAPRLKSILKGACDSKNEPNSFKALEEISQLPRTNAINLIFLMSTFSSEVEERLFPASSNMLYFHIFMDYTKSSKSRARTFLWLIWAYLEAPKIGDNSLNPFGPEFPVPVSISRKMAAQENIDTPSELVFGNQMTLERIAIMNLPTGPPGGQAPRPPLDLPDPPARPLITYKFKLRTAKEHRVHEEFHSIIRQKRKLFKEERRKRHNELRDFWNRSKDLDHLYDSDEDVALAQANVSGIPDSVLSTGLTTEYSDYGERFLSQAVALKRIANKVPK